MREINEIKNNFKNPGDYSSGKRTVMKQTTKAKQTFRPFIRHEPLVYKVSFNRGAADVTVDEETVSAEQRDLSDQCPEPTWCSFCRLSSCGLFITKFVLRGWQLFAML